MDSPSVTVLMPFYGDVGFMKLAVESVLAQNHTHWKLVVVDDCQPDESVPSWFADIGDPRVRYLRNSSNLGANANYSKALSQAGSEFVVFLGADDVMRPDYLARATDAMSRFPEVAVYHPGVRVVDPSGVEHQPLGDRIKKMLRPAGSSGLLQVLAGEDLARSLVLGNWTYFPSICWRRDAIRTIGFRPGYGVVQDLGLLLDLVLAGHLMIVDPAVTFDYRRHRSSDSAVRSRDGRRFFEEALLLEEFHGRFEQAGWHRAARGARWRLTSRVNAVMNAPGVARQAGMSAGRRLARIAVTARP